MAGENESVLAQEKAPAGFRGKTIAVGAIFPANPEPAWTLIATVIGRCQRPGEEAFKADDDLLDGRFWIQGCNTR